MLLKINQISNILAILGSFKANKITVDDIDEYTYDKDKLTAALEAGKFRVGVYRISIGNPAEPLDGYGNLTRQEWGIRVAHTQVGKLDNLLTTDGLYDELSNKGYVVDGVRLRTAFSYGELILVSQFGLEFYELAFNLIITNN